MRFTQFLSISAFVITTTALSGIEAHAAGFYVQEVSSSSAGAANAGAAAMPRDASVIFHNPSAITHLDGAQFNGAVHALYTHTELVDEGSTTGLTGDGGNPGGLKILPNLYAAAPIGMDGKLWAGVGTTTPFGLGPDYDNGFFGSILVTEAELSVIDVTPSIAYQINDYLSVGASAILQYAELKYDFLLSGTTPTGVDADDYATGFKISATLTPSDDLTIGAQYRSRTNLDFKGDIGVAGTNGDASGTLNLPDIATLGVSYKVDDQLTVMGGVEWFGWNNTDVAVIENNVTVDLPVSFLYENTLNVSLGGEYEYNDTWTLRAGYQYDETPTTLEARSPLNPDGNRHWFAVGATQTVDDQWSLDYGLTYIDIANGNINRDLGGGATVVGRAQDAYAVIGTFGVNYKF